MGPVAAISATVILAALAVLQVAVAAGAPLGRFVWGGTHTVLPPRLRIASAASIVLYAVFALVLMDRAGVTSVLPPIVSQVGAWVLLGYFVLGSVLNGISKSRDERRVMTPVCIVLAILTLLVALS